MCKHLIASFIIGPIFLGICMVWDGLSVKNALILYFGKRIEEEGWSTQSISIPIILLIVAGFLATFSTFFFIVVLNKRNLKLLLLSVLFIGSTLVFLMAGIKLLMKSDVDRVKAKIMNDSMANYYAEDSHPNNSSVQFWDYMQTNLECCGIDGYKDWVVAAQAPTIGFIPKSCCKPEHGNCTWTITHDTINSYAFVDQLIFIVPCHLKFNAYYSIRLLEFFANAMGFCQVIGILVGFVALIETLRV